MSRKEKNYVMHVLRYFETWLSDNVQQSSMTICPVLTFTFRLILSAYTHILRLYLQNLKKCFKNNQPTRSKLYLGQREIPVFTITKY